jgi:hypothetical protein
MIAKNLIISMQIGGNTPKQENVSIVGHSTEKPRSTIHISTNNDISSSFTTISLTRPELIELANKLIQLASHMGPGAEAAEKEPA